MRLSVQEPLALRPSEQRSCPFPIRHIAGISPEIELGEIARQVRLADVGGRPHHATLEPGEVRIARAKPPVCTYSSALVDAGMPRIFLADARVDAERLGPLP